MNDSTPFRYTLTRWQRLRPLLAIEGVFQTTFTLLLMGFFGVRTLFAVAAFEWLAVVVFGGLILFFTGLNRAMLVRLARIVFIPRETFNITFEDNAIGILMGTERWYMFLDCVANVRQYVPKIWTLEHGTGFVIHVPDKVLTEERIALIRSRMEHGRTPEGIAEAVARGRTIQAIVANRARDSHLSDAK